MTRRALGRLYIISDRDVLAGRDLAETIERALSGVPKGGALVQLRNKGSDGGELLATAKELLAVTRPRGCPLLVNDRIDVALAAGADGVHLPGSSFDVATARRLGGNAFLIGVSTHSVDEVERAANAGADLVVFSPIWPTPSKPNAVGLGTAELARAAQQHPALFALGGIDDPQRAQAARRAGAHGVAGIRAFIGASDPAAAASRFWRAVSG